MASVAPDLLLAFEAWIRGTSTVLPRRDAIDAWCCARLAEVTARVVEIAAAPVPHGYVAIATAKSARFPFAWAFEATPDGAAAAVRGYLGPKVRVERVDALSLEWLLRPARWTGSDHAEAAIRCAYRAFCEAATRGGKTPAMLYGLTDRPWTADDLLRAALADAPEVAAPEPVAPEPQVPGPDLERVLAEAARVATRWRRLLERSRARAARLDTRARRWRRVATLLRGELRVALDTIAALARPEKSLPEASVEPVAPAPAAQEPAPPALATAAEPEPRRPRRAAHSLVTPKPPKPVQPKEPKAPPAPPPAKPRAPWRARAPLVPGAPEIETAKGRHAVPQNDGGLAAFTPLAPEPDLEDLDLDLQIDTGEEIVEDEPESVRPALPPADVRRRIEDRLREQRERDKLMSGYYLADPKPEPREDDDEEPDEDTGDDEDDEDEDT